MTLNEFKERTLDYATAWFNDLCLLLAADRKAQKIEPEQKRKLIATALSLLLYLQEELNALLTDSSK